MSATLLRRAIAPALEENSDGVMHKEIEYTFYGRLTDFEQLQQAASKESHEQWEIKIPKTEENAQSGRFRIRKTTVDENTAPEYVLTTKTKLAIGKSNECSIPTTEDNFNQFKQLSDRGMLKDRYVFPIPDSDLKWEIDVFHKPGGGYFDWVKIDLEVEDGNSAIPSFPIEIHDTIMNQEGQRTEAEEAKVRSLYDYEFLRKNEFKE